jgi:hypothetical protein
MDLVSRQWSGKHKRVVQGINLTSLDQGVRNKWPVKKESEKG